MQPVKHLLQQCVWPAAVMQVGDLPVKRIPLRLSVVGSPSVLSKECMLQCTDTCQCLAILPIRRTAYV
jgi:hypothetical protein